MIIQFMSFCVVAVMMNLIFFPSFSFGFELGKFRVVSLPASWHHIRSYPHWIGFLLAIKIHMNTTTFEVLAIRVCSFLLFLGAAVTSHKSENMYTILHATFLIHSYWPFVYKIIIVLVIPFTFLPPLSNTHPISIAAHLFPLLLPPFLAQAARCSPLFGYKTSSSWYQGIST